MITEVEMDAFAKGAIRRVDVQESEMQSLLPLTAVDDGQLTERVEKILALVFHYGQNDFQSRDLPSVSVGDVVRMHGHRWAIMPVGWRKIEPGFDVPHDGGMWAYSL